MRTPDQEIDVQDQLDTRMGEVAYLAAALAVVVGQLEQVEARGEMHQLRNAVVGISRALDREIARHP
ncbi:hypothetical protein PANO111632_17180 [Paracoccus nototheniae]|uniref:Uncharacterized protein n=1 Tax=Paracoccus nototheniae TaxID=2489002 RepID=A0ABW4DYH4_9RHOB|nr:hypothetical protein [Paracoccus nototheniae]